MTEPVSSQMRTGIQAKLGQIAEGQDARILLAIESGSRAWGFHSPNSDYDVRFIYARSIDWHLTVEPGRDVIEVPISDELDISGWDLRKTLGLVLRSNAVVLEWLQAPIVYAEAEGFRAEMLEFAQATLRRRPVMWHYLRLAQRQFDRLRDADGNVRLKRYFYVIRPALALRWLRLREGMAIPPMNMARLMAETDLPPELTSLLEGLIGQKMAVGEMGSAAKTPDALDALITREIDAAHKVLGDTAHDARERQRHAADRLLQRWTRKCDPLLGQAASASGAKRV